MSEFCIRCDVRLKEPIIRYEGNVYCKLCYQKRRRETMVKRTKAKICVDCGRDVTIEGFTYYDDKVVCMVCYRNAVKTKFVYPNLI